MQRIGPGSWQSQPSHDAPLGRDYPLHGFSLPPDEGPHRPGPGAGHFHHPHQHHGHGTDSHLGVRHAPLKAAAGASGRGPSQALHAFPNALLEYHQKQEPMSDDDDNDGDGEGAGRGSGGPNSASGAGNVGDALDDALPLSELQQVR